MAAKAQVLMDCGADMISHEGLRAFKAMHDMSLQRIPSTLQWQVKGRKATEAEGEAVRLLYAPCIGCGCCLQASSLGLAAIACWQTDTDVQGTCICTCAAVKHACHAAWAFSVSLIG